MKGIQFLFLVVIAVFTSANPTANSVDTVTSLNENIIFKETPKTSSECAPFSRPADCDEVRKNGATKSGVYTIWPRSRKTTCKSAEVYCDMTRDGEGWTVLQRRGQYGNAQDYFNKTWELYKRGFGDLEKEFWMGNEMIYALTNQDSYSVRFDMRLVNGTSAYAVYDQFWIEDEEQKYQLNIAGYTGNAGDSMSTHHRMKFSTVDSANYKHATKCAVERGGGWWFNNCLPVNLNGLNKRGKNVSRLNDGIIWELFSGFDNSLEYCDIKIKPRHFR